jgi:hypothetical protein
MAYFVSQDVRNEALQFIKDETDQMVVLQGAPANYTEASTALGTGSGKKMAQVTLVSGDFTLADSVDGGRKVTVAAKNNVTIDVGGNADHIAWLDTSNSRIIAYTQLTVTQSGLIAANTVNIPAHAVTLKVAVVAT